MKRILVVEDERIVARDLQLTLARFGYEVPRTVATADDAIQSASERCPDLVLMDVRLKGELDGIDAAAILRQRFDVPVIFLTAYSDPETLARAQAVGAQGYLVKPVASDALRSAIEVALHRHEGEQRLRSQQRWYATTLRSIADAVISTDAAGNVTLMNPTAESLLGAREVHLADETTGEPLPSPVAQALRSRQAVHLESAVLRRQDGDRVVTAQASPVLSEDGQLMGAVLVLQDISEQRRLQRELELADRLASLGTLAAGVAHEINNPLTFVLSHLDEVLAAGQLPARSLELLQEARMGVGRIQDVVADLRVASRPAPHPQRRGEVRKALGWAIGVAGPHVRERARLEVQLDELPDVAVDESRLGQVLTNLLLNASQAITRGDPSTDEIRVVGRVQSGEVVLEVHDTGCGIAPEVRGRIFEPFFTTKGEGKGTGLGLSISRGVLEPAGGRIEVESELGAGSVFRVFLPVHTETSEPPSEEPVQAAPFRGQILVVDDEPMVRRALGRSLSSAHEVTLAESARQAVALIEGGRRFDLLLCDMMMPERTGADLHEILQKTAPEQARRMVFVTGATFTPRTLEFSRTSAHPRLDKPFSPATLLSLVGALLAEWGRAG